MRIKNYGISFRLQFVGPIIVDTTPSMFVGRILVHLDGGYLVTEWGDDGFTDSEDADLTYQVGIGKITTQRSIQ